MRIKSFLVAALAAMTITSCSNDDHEVINAGGGDEAGAAYMSIIAKVPAGTGTRASAETAPERQEGKINSLYALAFDGDNKIVTQGQTSGAIKITIGSNENKPEAFPISPDAEGLLLIANPGAKLLDFIKNTGKGDTFDAVNAAIKGVKATELTAASSGFTMINTGGTLFDDEAEGLAGKAYTQALVDISAKIQFVGTAPADATPEEAARYHQDAATAKTAAQKDANRADIKIERLSAKIVVKAKTEDGGVTVANDATFSLEGWVLDVLNTTFFPFAKKINTGSTPSNSDFYANNFYTIDPNYTGTLDDVKDGIVYNKALDHEDLVNNILDIEWNSNKDYDYAIENTMTGDMQKFQNATRVVVRAKYYPKGFEVDEDWFSYRSTAYKNLAELHKKYALTGDDEDEDFNEACDNFYAALKAYATANTLAGFNAANFAALTETELALFTYGGEIIKGVLVGDASNNVDPKTCIRWYAGGINYYWYEIKHDDAITDKMAWAKYGIVRNNWYSLTVNSVSRWGTPWYPSVDPEEPEDPDGPGPGEDIDQGEGYLGITVEVAPWIKWEQGIEW